MALNSELSQEVDLELTGNSRENGGKTKSRDDLHDPSLPPETPAYSLQSQKPHYKLFKKSNLVYGLPMTFEGNLGPVTVMAVPDSGSDHNVMSLGLALHLGMRLEWSVAEKTELIFLDGSAVIPTALVHASCRFARTFSFDWKMRCTFLVLPSLIEDLIISASFLDKTATFTMFRNRLVQMSLKTPRTLKICTMGAINRRLTCCIDGEAIVALPDSGSDVDVISLAYATKRKFKWENTLQEVVFANGRTKIARRKFVAQLSLGSSARLIKLKEDADADEFADNERGTGDLIDSEINVQPLSAQNANRDDTPVQRVINTTFYILDGITVDALIGAKSIESLQVYTHHTQHLTIQTKRDIETFKICRIALSSKIRSNAKSIVTSSRQTRSDGLPRPNLEAQLNEADQQENSRREESSRVTSLLTGDAKAAFDHSEQDRRRAFEEYRSSLLRNHAP
ncbi:hypothetical protein COCCADRAFT_8314 [Bipolaris zeicola 26-R-13]|uniref:Aspartic peptidase DDI1-type domain-containing protein n=1 Tax=Cochliobolus carbonum (strain 26-R-13) TaxID=930089 RepID=W6XQ11_COCC2|nr:uncharacterized protein COCCADRAFT_8314 [Bipolaris zeicola 26-R-13]EUC29462.1 hypothetical protein COCCADRAFT_8314 [Bipolaris zeicola 26-R-13]